MAASTARAKTKPTWGDAARIAALEDWLDEHKIAWRYVEAFELDKVDAAASLKNQTRLSPLDDKTVERYASDYQRGDHFPALVLAQHDKAVLAAGGNHRIAGARAADVRTHPAYVLSGLTPEQLHLVAIQDNRYHGLPFTTEELVFHAVHLINGGSYSVADAARITGLSRSTVNSQIEANRGTERAIERDIFGWSAMSTSTKARLNAIADDDLFQRVATMVGHGDILQGEVSELVGRLNKVDAARQADILDSLEQDAQQRTRRTRGHPPSMRAPRAKLMGDLEGILKFEPEVVAADCTTPQQRAQLANQIKATARRLVAIEKELWK